MNFELNMTRSNRMIWVIMTCLFLSACASLPEVQSNKRADAVLVSPTVTNAQGKLSDKKSTALLDNRWRKSKVNVSKMAALEEAATGSPLISGNRVTLLYDGPQTMASMMAAIKDAKDHINLETYIFDQDELGTSFSDLLIERQRSGVQVNIIYDSIGTIGTSQEFFDKMRDAGIRLLAFNPINPLQLIGPWEPNNRDHRKILVIDGTVAFAGGVNISSSYANSSLFRSRGKHKPNVGWRDTHIKIEGPAVAALQWAFLDTWIRGNSPDLPEKNYFPDLKNVGDKLVRVLLSGPDSEHDIYKAYVLAIQEAKNSIQITCAYFVPEPKILQALKDAVQRGVDVKIILPGVSDSGVVLHATRSYYEEMLESGIRLFQLQIAVLHAKTAVIDQVWSTVGSTNIDTRSFLHNYEVNVVVFDVEFGHAMENAFREDLRYSVEITKETWENRSRSKRLKEWIARKFEYWL
jgi:cardiolipin synthase